MADFLTPDHYDPFLSEEAQQASRLTLLIDRAERKVVDRYRKKQLELDFDTTLTDQPIQLEGWREDTNGDPDTQAMDSELLFALRDATARIVEHWVTAPDSNIQSISQGDRSVTYRDSDSLPLGVFAPLRQFDQRDVWH